MVLEAKRMVHIITDCIQAVLGYIELGEYVKAESHVQSCIQTLETLAVHLKTLRKRDRNVQ